MPWSETTLLSKLNDIPKEHAELYKAFRTFLIDNDSSSANANNYAKALILFSRFIGKKDLYQVEREDILAFLDSHKKLVEEDQNLTIEVIVLWNFYQDCNHHGGKKIWYLSGFILP